MECQIGIFGDSVGMEMLTGLKKIVPKCSRTRLKNVLKNISTRPRVFTFLYTVLDFHISFVLEEIS